METNKENHPQKKDYHGEAEILETLEHAKDIAQVGVSAVSFEDREAMEKKLVKKLDMRLLPLIMLICTKIRS